MFLYDELVTQTFAGNELIYRFIHPLSSEYVSECESEGLNLLVPCNPRPYSTVRSIYDLPLIIHQPKTPLPIVLSHLMADQAKLRKRLEALLKKPENQVCCDCNRRGARWASANLGNFFCIECSGIHRNLGVHISFVRSVNLDTWTVKQVEVRRQS
jgi:stromal membrane-associated protein